MEIKKRHSTFGPMLLVICGVLLITALTATASEATDQKVDYEAGFYYTVKEGDTLWDLSQRFSDTPWQWPDLWRENKQIPNPHWIYPGERIRLYRKTGEHGAPTQPTQPVSPVTPQAQSSTSKPAPAPQVDFRFINIDRIGFIRKPPVTPLGKIFKSQENNKLISEHDIVYVSYESPESTAQFAPGSRMTVYRTMSPTEKKQDLEEIGTQHLLLGVVEITQKESKYAICKVMASYDAIETGDLLMPYEPQSPDIPVVETPPGIDGNIIAAERHTKLMSALFVAFINKGSNDGLRPGNILEIYQQENARPDGGEQIQLAPVYSGSLIVLRAEKETSTVVITKSVKKIAPGDKVHTK